MLDRMLTLTRDEIRDLSQIVISPGLKHAPNVFAFTEQGIAMLSSVLNSDSLHTLIELFQTRATIHQ